MNYEKLNKYSIINKNFFGDNFNAILVNLFLFF